MLYGGKEKGFSARGNPLMGGGVGGGRGLRTPSSLGLAGTIRGGIHKSEVTDRQIEMCEKKAGEKKSNVQVQDS